jgi:multidrug efflux pump subunit AcrA (membrane-fusion protein)
MTEDTQLNWLLHEPAPAPVTPQVRKRSRRFSGRRAVATLVVVAVLLVAAGGGVWAATGSSAASYRWAAASRGSVDQTLNSYGTVKPINQADVAFPISGTIAAVAVKVGQKVKAGQTLATIDVTNLQSQLNSAKSALATAQAKLVSDTEAQASGTTVASTSGTSSALGPADAATPAPLGGGGRSGGSGSNGSTSQSGSLTSAQDAVTAAQQKLLADQHTVDTLTAAVATDLRSGTTTCTSLISSLQAIAKVGSTDDSTPVPDSAECTDLLNKVLTDQQAVTTAQNAVSADETALTAAITKLVAAADAQPNTEPSTQPTPTPSSTPAASPSGNGTRTGSTGSASSGSGRTSGGGGTTVTAAQLVVDQAQVDADAAAVIVAAQSLKQATLVSPLSGTVAEVDVTAGSAASASSTAVIVIGPGNDQVTTTVGDLDLDKVLIGTSATVTPDGTDKPVSGKVTAVGVLPVSSTSSSTTAASSTSSSSSSTTAAASSTATYAVTISLASGGLYSGSGADVAILIKRSSNVLTVPTSAVTSLGTLHTVTVLDGGKVQRKVVTIGAAGPTLTEVKSGLTAGQHVVLARLDEALPTSGTTGLTGRGGLGRTTGGLTGGTLTGGGGGARPRG